MAELIDDAERLEITGVPRTVLVDDSERYVWKGPNGEKIHYKRFSLDHTYRLNLGLYKGIVNWTGFTKGGKAVKYSAGMTERLPYLRTVSALVAASTPEKVEAPDTDTILYYRRPIISKAVAIQEKSMVRGKLDFSIFVPSMIRYCLVDWKGVYTIDGNGVDFDADLIPSLPADTADIFWTVIQGLTQDGVQAWENELKNSTPTSDAS